MDVADTLTEGTSLAFHARYATQTDIFNTDRKTPEYHVCCSDMGKPMPFKPPPTFTRKFTEEDFKYRGISSVDYGTLRILSLKHPPLTVPRTHEFVLGRILVD